MKRPIGCPDDMPVFLCDVHPPSKRGSIATYSFDCPYCLVRHTHSAEDGHRSAHCGYGSPLLDQGYWVIGRRDRHKCIAADSKDASTVSDKTCKRCGVAIPVPTCKCNMCQSAYKATKWCGKACSSEAGKKRSKVRREIIKGCDSCRWDPYIDNWPMNCAYCKAKLAKVTDYVGGHNDKG